MLPSPLVLISHSSLEEIGERSQALFKKKTVAGFLDKSKDSQEVVNLIEHLRTAIVYYQVSGIHLVRTGANVLETVLAATIDLQPDRGTGCKVSFLSSLRLHVEKHPLLQVFP